MSIKPGATTMPRASMVRVRGASFRFPMATTLPSRIPTSPEYQGDPVPSMMWPLTMTTSNGDASGAAQTLVASTHPRDRYKTNQPHVLSFMAMSFFYGNFQTNPALPPRQTQSERAPQSQRQPFVSTEVTGNTGHDFHQNHKQPNCNPDCGYSTLARCGSHSKIRSTGRHPARR